MEASASKGRVKSPARRDVGTASRTERGLPRRGSAAGSAYRPQLALLVNRPPTGPQWIHELKLDGYRIGIVISRGKARLISRNHADWTDDFPEIATAAAELGAPSAVMDGELVVLDAKGVSSFEALQKRAESREGLTYFAFDLLSLGGRDLRREPLIERKRQLKALLRTRVRRIRYTEHVDTEGEKVLRQACVHGAEGIISKCRSAPYRSAARHPDWQKTKCIKRQEFVIGGFTEPDGTREGIGALLIGYYEGRRFAFAGKVGTGRGWNNTFSLALRKRLEAIEVKTCPFDPPPKGGLRKHAHWVKPRTVVEVEFTEWTAGGHIRHPSLQGIRIDKKATEVVRETPVLVER